MKGDNLFMTRKTAKSIALLILAALLLSMLPAASFAEEGAAHIHAYHLAEDSYEATAAEGGYRHYVCAECGDAYSYETDPTVYTVNPKTGEPVTLDYAANPYLPNWEFMPDNELHVLWSREDNEWRVYALGSHDTGLSGWCGNDICCWSAPVYDLSAWRFEAILRDTGRFFACDFNYDLTTDLCILYAFPFFGNAEMQGTHLWINGHSVPDSYFDVPLTEGDGVVDLDGVNHFDPAIYISEDGVILVVYDGSHESENGGTSGTKNCELAMVNADRTGVEWAVPVMMAEGDPNSDGFNPKHYEGSSIDVVEVDGHSFFVIQYSYKSNWTDEDYEKDVDGEKRWWPLAYVYSDPDMTIDELKDFTGWHWGGIIGDNGGFFRKDAGSDEITEHDDPTYCWGNNHGSLVFINGQWYISNHRHTSNAAGRQGFIEKIEMSYTDGKLVIKPTEYTSSIGDSIEAYAAWPAYIACHLWPTVFSETHEQTLYIENPLTGAPEDYWTMMYAGSDYAEHRSPIVGITDGAEVGFKYLNFGDEAAIPTLSILVSKDTDCVDGVMSVYVDAPSEEKGGVKIGEIAVTDAALSEAAPIAESSDGTQWRALSSEMSAAVDGVHGVYFVFSSAEEGTICKLDEFTFAK